MLLFNKQLNAIFEFCPIDILLCKAGGNTVSDLAIQSLKPYALNICSLTFHHSVSFFFFAYIENYLGHLVLLLSGKAVVLPNKITFKRIDSAILKLTLFALKIFWCGILMLSRELINPVFTKIALSASRTYSH